MSSISNPNISNQSNYDLALNCKKTCESKMLKTGGLCLLILAIGVGAAFALGYSKEVLDFAKAHKWESIATASLGGAALLSSSVAFGYFAYKRSQNTDFIKEMLRGDGDTEEDIIYETRPTDGIMQRSSSSSVGYDSYNNSMYYSDENG